MTPLLIAAALTLAQARDLARRAAETRLSEAARDRGAQVQLAPVVAAPGGWTLQATATHACEPGQAVCSALLGRFRASRAGTVRDADAADAGLPAPDLAPLVAYAARRDQCEHLAGEEGYDAARRRELDRLIGRSACLRLERDRARLRARYADPASRAVLRPLAY